jgi:hypothetical protein
MEYWEFLLQKEGDRSWLPLESPNVEILEGRYRIVARSSRPNMPVEIRVSHNLAGDLPKRRMRSTQTNRDGLVVVIPFTRLQPGGWEMLCRGDLMADMMGEGWQYSVRLQVVAQETEEEWNPDWQRTPEAQTTAEIRTPEAQTIPEQHDRPAFRPLLLESEPTVQPVVKPIPLLASLVETFSEPAFSKPTTLSVPEVIPAAATLEASIEAPDAATAIDPAIAKLLAIDEMPLDQMAERLSEQLVASIFQELDETDEILETSAAPARLAAVPAPSDSQIRLTLAQTAFVVRRGQVLSLKGQIESLAPLSDQESGFSGEINVCLRDPQQAVVLLEVRYPLTEQPLPMPFEYSVTVPADCQTHLLLGELTLDVAGDVISTHAFTITTDLDQLLEAIADEFTGADQLQPPLEFADEPAELNLTFLDLITSKPSQLPSQLAFQPSLQTLPPQLYRPDPDRPKSKPLQLPFAERSTPKAVVIDQTDTAIAVPDAEIPGTVPVAVPGTEVLTAEVPEFERISESQPVSATSDQAKPGQIESAPKDLSPVEESQVSSFTAIDLADLPLEWEDQAQMPWRSQLVHTPVQLPATPEDAAFRSLNLQERFWSRLNAMATDTELSDWLRSSVSSESSSAPNREQMLGGVDAMLAAQEVVVEDALPQPVNRSHSIEPPDSLILSEDEPVPSPRLEIPSGELTAGKSVQIRVKLPNIMPRIYVKLWLRDRQTRSLLDGPRWLVDFTPTGLGDLETRVPIAVPFGCFEVQFEAIAVEMATQRESNKVSIDRLIVPAGLPVLSLDELDV